MASGESGAPRTHSFVAGFRYPERNRRGPLVINPLLPNRESPVADLASRPARKDGEKTRFSPHHTLYCVQSIRRLRVRSTGVLPVTSRQDATAGGSLVNLIAFTMPTSTRKLARRALARKRRTAASL